MSNKYATQNAFGLHKLMKMFKSPVLIGRTVYSKIICIAPLVILCLCSSLLVFPVKSEQSSSIFSFLFYFCVISLHPCPAPQSDISGADMDALSAALEKQNVNLSVSDLCRLFFCGVIVFSGAV